MESYGIPSFVPLENKKLRQEILLAGDTNRLVAELTFATWHAFSELRDLGTQCMVYLPTFG